MSTRATSAPTAANAPLARSGRARTVAQAAAYVGAIAAVAFTAVTLVASVTPDGHPFTHAGDYWYCRLVPFPAMAAPLVLVLALHSLQSGEDGRLGRVGAIVLTAGLAVFVAMGCYGLLIGRATSLGPTYLLATLATFVGIVLFAIGSWRVGVLPRWLLVLWVLAWIVGGPFAQGISPLVLAVVYVLIGVLVGRPSTGSS